MMEQDGAPRVQPLFASNQALWLRIWLATQGVAILGAVYVVALDPLFHGAIVHGSSRVAIIATLLFAYHFAGFAGFSRMMRRPWTVTVFVPLGWIIVTAAISTNAAFVVLIFGLILQGFIFLPFQFGMAALVAVVLLMVAAVMRQPAMASPNPTISRIAGVLAVGIMAGTVMLYIHRANRDAALRSRLLQQLDAAQRDLADRAREAGVQGERQRLAHDIHDTLAQGFASVIKHLEAIELSFATSTPADAADAIRRAEPHLTNAQAVSRTSLAEIRHLVLALRPRELVDAPLAAAIERLVAQWSHANDVAATTRLEPVPALPPDADVILLRAAQESLSNVARHARASNVDVSLECVDGLVLLSIEDDGCGIDDVDAAASDGFGIVGMRERVRPFGGRVLIESGGRSGTSVTVALPLDSLAAVHA
jgi:signal transduction histidine kinase